MRPWDKAGCWVGGLGTIPELPQPRLCYLASLSFLSPSAQEGNQANLSPSQQDLWGAEEMAYETARCKLHRGLLLLPAPQQRPMITGGAQCKGGPVPPACLPPFPPAPTGPPWITLPSHWLQWARKWGPHQTTCPAVPPQPLPGPWPGLMCCI